MFFMEYIPVLRIWFTMSFIGLTMFCLIDLSGQVFDRNSLNPVLFFLSEKMFSKNNSYFVIFEFGI